MRQSVSSDSQSKSSQQESNTNSNKHDVSKLDTRSFLYVSQFINPVSAKQMKALPQHIVAFASFKEPSSGNIKLHGDHTTKVPIGQVSGSSDQLYRQHEQTYNSHASMQNHLTATNSNNSLNHEKYAPNMQMNHDSNSYCNNGKVALNNDNSTVISGSILNNSDIPILSHRLNNNIGYSRHMEPHDINRIGSLPAGYVNNPININDNDIEDDILDSDSGEDDIPYHPSLHSSLSKNKYDNGGYVSNVLSYPQSQFRGVQLSNVNDKQQYIECFNDIDDDRNAAFIQSKRHKTNLASNSSLSQLDVHDIAIEDFSALTNITKFVDNPFGYYQKISTSDSNLCDSSLSKQTNNLGLFASVMAKVDS